MDLQLAARVLWRFKWLVVGGVLLGALLAVLSFVSIGAGSNHPTFTYRKAQTWAGTARVLVAQPGFRLGTR